MNWMRKASWNCLVWIGLFILVSGCSKSETGAGAPPLDEVRLGYFANVTHAQAVLGVASGDFQVALGSIKLSPKVFNAGPSLIEALFAGEIDIGYVGPGPVITGWWHSHGEELRVIAGSAANGVVIVAGPKSNINTLADLAGKKIASPQRDNTQDISARHYLLAGLHQDNDRNVIPVTNSEQVGRMLAGDIDAAWDPEPWGSRLVAQAGGKIIAEEKNLWPDHQFSLTVVIARQEFLRDHPDVVQKILAVHKDWTTKLAASPEMYAPQLATALSALTKSNLPPGVLESSLKHVRFSDDPLRPTFATMAQWSLDLGVIKEPISLNGLFDTSILDGLP
jgi:NitT/TauT family transport system substrate-binding protein